MAVTVSDKGISGIVYETAAAADDAIVIKNKTSNAATLTINGDGTIVPTTRTTITQTYSTADATFSAYSADAESVEYSGGSTDAALALNADLNALRTAYETLRAHAEDSGKLLNSVVDALQAAGILA